jgi:hypothetical protein
VVVRARGAQAREPRAARAAGEAAPGPVALLFGCSLATLALNGLIFWVVLLPEKRLRVSDTLATVNAFATMLAYLPFKLSVWRGSRCTTGGTACRC